MTKNVAIVDTPIVHYWNFYWNFAFRFWFIWSLGLFWAWVMLKHRYDSGFAWYFELLFFILYRMQLSNSNFSLLYSSSEWWWRSSVLRDFLTKILNHGRWRIVIGRMLEEVLIGLDEFVKMYGHASLCWQLVFITYQLGCFSHFRFWSNMSTKLNLWTFNTFGYQDSRSLRSLCFYLFDLRYWFWWYLYDLSWLIVNLSML